MPDTPRRRPWSAWQLQKSFRPAHGEASPCGKTWLPRSKRFLRFPRRYEQARGANRILPLFPSLNINTAGEARWFTPPPSFRVSSFSLEEHQMKGSLAAVFFLSLLAIAARAQSTPAHVPCESLRRVAIPQTRILGAETIERGAFKLPVELPPWMAAAAGIFKILPAFCRVTVEATPSRDSRIRIEIWLPADNWNGEFQAHGNGGFAGELDYVHLATSILGGYTSASTDTGHSAMATDAAWALGHPEKVTDFGYRAIHVMTAVAKDVIRARFGKGPSYAYFLGCSNGGRQALVEAQRFPDDYNG